MSQSVSVTRNNSSLNLAGYQRALDDFGIIQLLQKLILVAPNTLEVEERETLAAMLIERLTTSLNSSLIDQCLNPMYPCDGGVISDLITTEINALPSSLNLAENFSYYLSLPYFAIGEKVQWKPIVEPTDWGIAIGRFYAYAHHHCRWAWKYVIWLAQDSPSSAWTIVDTAWEEDLERQK
jgi:hypothetical protein